MELKQQSPNKPLPAAELLIVPYGIETGLQEAEIWHIQLLIVPYGIETLNRVYELAACILLIVPYGIETVKVHEAVSEFYTFNRTLWN